MNAGDVVVRFIGDTSQLDQSFNSVAVQQQQAAQAAGAAALELKAAQKELRLAMQATQAQGGMTEGNMQRLADAEQRVALAGAEAAEAQATLKTQLGIGAEKASLMSEAVGEVSHHLGGMLALMAVAEGLKEFVSHVQESTLKLANLSETTGINITKLAGFKQAGEMAGVEMEGMGKGLNKLVQNQVVAIEHTGKQRDAFAGLGITVNELKHLSPDELFVRVGEALGAAEHKGVALNAAAQLMGRGIGQQLLPVFLSLHGHLEETVEELGKETNVTEKAGQAARDWQAQMARMTDVIHAGFIPVMQAMVPVIKVVESAFGFLSHGIKLITDVIGGFFLAWFDGVKSSTQATVALMHGQWSEVARITKAGAEEQVNDLKSIGTRWKEHHEEMATFLKEVWGTQMHAVIKDTDGDLSDLTEKSKKTTEEFAQEAKKRLDAALAAIQGDRTAAKLALEEKRIDIETFARQDVALLELERSRKVQYYDELIALYRKAGEASKLRQAQEEKQTQITKNNTDREQQQIATTKSLAAENLKYGDIAAQAFGKSKEVIDANDKSVEAMEKNWRKFIPQWSVDATKLNHALETVGVQGLDKMKQKLDAAQKAEALLNKSGIHDGQIWLQVQRAKLQAMVAIERAEATNAGREHRRASQTEKDLAEVERRLKKLGATSLDTGALFDGTMQKMQQATAQFASDIGTAFAAVIQGQMSASDAILQSVGKMIGAMCDHWAEYFMAMAIADMFWHPARAAAELAAAAALKMAGALAGSLGGGGGSKQSTGDGERHPLDTSNPATQSGSNPSTTLNVPRMAAGGLVTSPTLLMAGDARMSGASRDEEAILPLGNRRAMDAIADAIAARMGGGGGGMTVNVGGMISPDNLNKVMRQMTRQVDRRQARLNSRNSYRNTGRG
jgi:hypothetical protein